MTRDLNRVLLPGAIGALIGVAVLLKAAQQPDMPTPPSRQDLVTLPHANAIPIVRFPLATPEPVITIPAMGPAIGSGTPCQILIGDGEETRPADRPQHMLWMPSYRYVWVDATTLPDGEYVGILRVRGGRVVPCAEEVSP